MAKLTTQQSTSLVDNGEIQRRITDDIYEFHKFIGKLDGCYYECMTPQIYDLSLDESTTMEQAISIFKTHFKTQDYKGSAPLIVNETDW